MLELPPKSFLAQQFRYICIDGSTCTHDRMSICLAETTARSIRTRLRLSRSTDAVPTIPDLHPLGVEMWWLNPNFCCKNLVSLFLYSGPLSDNSSFIFPNMASHAIMPGTAARAEGVSTGRSRTNPENKHLITCTQDGCPSQRYMKHMSVETISFGRVVT